MKRNTSGADLTCQYMAYSDLLVRTLEGVRFLRPEHLKGSTTTLTIFDVWYGMDSGDRADRRLAEGKPPRKSWAYKDSWQEEAPRKAVILLFKDTPLKLPLPDTQAYCLNRMFGEGNGDWLGKRVTLFAQKLKIGSKVTESISVWGSPDLSRDIVVMVPQGRAKRLAVTLYKQ